MPPSLIRAMPERKRFFSIDVFPYLVREKSQIPSENTIFAEIGISLIISEVRLLDEIFHALQIGSLIIAFTIRCEYISKAFQKTKKISGN